MDQAQSLREYMHRYNVQMEKRKPSRVVTITSGKGGVGKSNFTLNFALSLQSLGKKVVILDLDLSTANINILMGISPRYRLLDVLFQRKNILDVIEKGLGGIEYIYGGLELEDLLRLDQRLLAYFVSQLEELQNYADFILLDTGAGISKELVEFILASDETILITTPEPTAIADAYAVLKTVHQFAEQSPKFRLVINRAQSYAEAVETSKRMQNASSHFLKIELKTLGYLLEDSHVRKSVKLQTPFLITFPNCTASKNMKQIVYSYMPDLNGIPTASSKGIRGFFEKVLLLRKSL
ncbi:MinD/ParA family protein [Bacillus xiapuensis]|uniref:MinD/ParA family protein n=1 Tax=Bacillus xiapuensis TaxID=2014075 RepID=A0ABU6NG18_9BACI|nr:MinD/ParA family protein [Bacillus xiapuensis]